MALVNTGTDPWLLEYEACEKLSREIMEQLHARDKELPGTMPYDSLSGRVRLRLRQYSNEVTQLKMKLKSDKGTSSMVDGENERRMRKTEELQVRLVQLERQFEGASASRGAAAKRAVSSGWIDDDDEEDEFNVKREILENTPVQDLRANQAQMLRDQEAGLEELSQVIARQKKIAVVIHDEVDDQNALLDDIADNVDRVDTRVRGETNQISTIIRRDSVCGYWIVIILLMIGIVAILLAPGR